MPDVDASGFVLSLRDGTRVRFRPVGPQDKERLRLGFERLSPRSRYQRFFRHIDHLSEAQLRYLTEVDGVDHVAWIALLEDEPGHPGVGVARWIRLRGEPDVAEAAVTVVDEWHDRGLGTALLQILAGSAASAGVRAFRAWVLGDNRPMLGLLEDLGATRGRWESGVWEVEVELPTEAEELRKAAPAEILRAVARGLLEGEARPESLTGTRFRSAEPPRS